MRTALYIGVAIGVYFWLKHTFGNWSENLNDKKNTPLAFVAIILLAVLYFGTPCWGTKIPGSFFERDEYQGCFYVHAYPNGNRVQSYRLPALIRSVIKSDRDLDDRVSSWREYHVDYIMMPNGGRLTFYNCSEQVYLNGFASLQDDNGNNWSVTLTDVPWKTR